MVVVDHLFEDLQDPLARHRLSSIGPIVCAQRLKDIHEGQNARLEIDRLRLQSVGITAAVEFLVMRSRNLGYPAQFSRKGNLLEHLHAHGRVIVYLFSLGVGQTPFANNEIR